MRTAAIAAALALLAGCNEGDTCDNRTDDVGDLCIPSTLAPGITSAIQVREACGAGCTGVPECTALFRNGQVVLQVEQEVCTSAFTGFCLDQVCLQRTMPCTLPALSEGDYTMTVPGGPPRLLRVRSGGQSSCSLRAPDAGVQ